MIVIWKGWGLLVLVIALVVSLATMMLLAALGVAHGFGPALGAILSAVAIWVVGNKLNSPLKNRVLVDQNTGAEVILKPEHSLFFIKMQYWAFIVGAFGLFMLVGAFS